MLEVPEVIQRHARARGDDGERWLRELPEIVRSLETDWDVRVGRVLAGGTAAFVADAERADGTHAVMKVAIGGFFEGHAYLGNEIAALLADNGRGMAQLLAHDVERAALLLERLGPNIVELGLTTDEQFVAITSCVQKVWHPAPDAGLQSLADKGPWLADFIARAWEELNRPVNELVVESAAAAVARRLAAYEPDKAVLLHGDAHPWNTLQNPAGGYKLIDPDGLIGEPAYDLSGVMRDYNDELLEGDTVGLAQARAARLSSLTGIDAQAIWDWGFVERVSSGLLLKQLGNDVEAEGFLRVAERTAAVSA